MTMPYLSVIIPAYNEINNLKKRSLDPVYNYLKSKTYDFELLLVDDGSVDETLAYFHAFAQKGSAGAGRTTSR